MSGHDVINIISGALSEQAPWWTAACLSGYAQYRLAQSSLVLNFVQAGRPFGVRCAVSRAMHARRRYRDIRNTILVAIDVGRDVCAHGSALEIFSIILIIDWCEIGRGFEVVARAPAPLR